MLVALVAACVTSSRAQTPSLPTLQNFTSALERVVNGPEMLTAEPLPAPTTAPDGQFVAPLVKEAAEPVIVQDDDGLISLSVRDATLRQVLAALAETQGFNLVIAAPADSQVTAEFKRMPLQDVFATLMNSTGHTWTENDGVIIVTSNATGGTLTPSAQGRRVAVIELDFASAADLQPAVEGLLSAVGQSHYVETNPEDNRRTKELLIVEDLEPYLQRIERYVAEADQPPRQVLIEVNLLQVTLEDDQRCGVNFEALGRVAGTPLTLGSQGLTSVLPGTPINGGAGLPSGSAWSTGSSGFFVQTSGGDLDLVIEALIATTDAKSLANPRLLCVNGQTSRIQVGEEIGYTTTTTVNTTTTGNVQFLPTGTILEVTPRITRDGKILLRVEPEVSTGAINPETSAPDKQLIQVQTNALLHSGQGMIIGGLIQENDSTKINRIPVLSTIPYVSGLFQRRVVEKQRRELIVALVPHVLPYSPEIECRNQEEVMRATDPLLTGPLVRNPRPYEPRLPDPKEDLRGYRPWPWGKKTEGEIITTAVCDPPEGSTGPRRLPDIMQPELIEPSGVEVVPAEPEVAERPKRSWFR
jgi:type II secretory pathway component GspD/PulD (secretin)